MNILISGGSGNVGKVLIPMLEMAGHRCYVLTRKPKVKNDIFWDPKSAKGELPQDLIFHAVVNLAGFSVSNRWSEKNKKEMVDSRLLSTLLLKKMVSHFSAQPLIWIQSSAVGIYRNTQEWQDENSKHGEGFLAELTQKWEGNIEDCPPTWRKVILRIGVVLDKHSGALKSMMPIFKLGLGSGLGSGKQWMSWIAIEDLSRMIIHSIENNQVHGTYNAVGPEPVQNNTFTQSFCRALQRPQWLPNVPSFVLKAMIGEMSSMVLNSQRISSKKIEQTGFVFQYKTISENLHQLFP